MVHDGDTRRSEEAFADVINRGISAVVVVMVELLSSVIKFCLQSVSNVQCLGS